MPNTGGGGGGAERAASHTNGAAGGSGIVIVRYRTPFDSTGWYRRMPITFTNDVRLNTLTNFPALVILDTNKVDYSQFQPAGRDLRFADANGVELRYEVESWNTLSNSYIWVQVPAMTAGCAIDAYWGNASATLPAYRTNGTVWTEGYAGVWHLASASASDSSTNHFSSTVSGSPTLATGAVGSGLSFNNSSTKVAVSLGAVNAPFTVEGWVRFNQLNQDSSDYDYLMMMGTPNNSMSISRNASDNRYYSYSGGAQKFGAALTGQQWVHVSAVYDTASPWHRLYVNGATQAVDNLTSALNTDGTLYMGAYSGTANWLDGQADELRVSTVARSSNWVWACYLNQASNTIFSQYGAVQSVGGAEPTIVNRPVSNVTTNGATFTGWLVSTGASPTAVCVFWGENTNSWANTNWFGGTGWTDNSYPSTNVTLTPDRTYYYTFGASNATTNVVASSPVSLITGEVTVEATDAAAQYPGNNGEFTIRRPAALTNGALVVSYDMSGSAVPNVDYDELSGTVTLNAGVSNAVFPVVPRSVVNPNRTAVLTLSSGGYAIGPANAATVTVVTSAMGANATRTWNGGGADIDWSTQENWVNDLVPGYTDTALFTTNGATAGVTNYSRLDTDRTIAGLDVKNPDAGTAITLNHWLDLGGNRLTVTGNVGVAWHTTAPGASRGTTTWTVSNGVLQIGTAATPRILRLSRTGNNQSSNGKLIMGPGGTLQGHLSAVTVGGGIDNTWARLDLRQAALTDGTTPGTFRAGTLDVGNGGSGSMWGPPVCEALFGAGLTNLEVTSALNVGWGSAIGGFIGQYGSDGTAPMPDNVNIKLGVSTNSRATVYIGWDTYWGARGIFVAGSGGVCTGYLGSLNVGGKPGGGTGGNYIPASGRLDLRNMTSCMLDVNDTVIGSSGASDKAANGYVHLPPGTATFKNLTVGNTWGYGLLHLYGTTARVTNALTINATGTISNDVRGVSGGLDIPAGVTPTVDGKIRIVFAEADVSGGTNGVYWGLRMAGDQRLYLQGLVDAGKLTWNDTLIPGSAQIYYAAGYTYVAHGVAAGPAVIAKSLTLEVRPGVPKSFAIHIDDVDASPTNPPPDSRSITNAFDLTPGDPSVVTLPAVTLNPGDPDAVYTIALTHVKGAEQTTEDATITITLLADGVGDPLTWSGAARMVLEGREEWLWSGNWLGGRAPAAVTANTLTFGDDGTGTNRLEQNRSVGGLTVNNSSARHDFDLDGYVLTVSNGALNVGSSTRTTEALVCGGGTLRIANADVTVNSGGGTYSRLTLSNAVLDARFKTLRLGDTVSGVAGSGELDLRDATITNGLMPAVNLQVGFCGSSDYFTHGILKIDASAGLQTIVVSNEFSVCSGPRAGYGRFGDPANSYKLPPDVSITVGSWNGSRGILRVGRVQYGIPEGSGWNGDGYLAASSGGTLTAWLSDLSVGYGGLGILDLQTMNAVTVDATDFLVGDKQSYRGQGTVRLPAGTVRVGNLRVGTGVDLTTGLLELYGTAMTVDGSATIGQANNSAIVRTWLDGTSCGLHFPEGVTPAFGTNGRIDLRFETPSAGSGPYYGLRFGGKREQAVLDLVAAGKIVWTDDAVGNKVGVFTYQGDAYVGIPPAAGTLFSIR